MALGPKYFLKEISEMLGTQKAMIRQAGGRGVGPKVDIINRIMGPRQYRSAW